MRIPLFITLAAIAALSVTPAYAGDDQFFGMLFGMTAGGLVGSQFGHGTGKDVAIGMGVLAGGWIGNDLGRAADNAHYGPVATYSTPPYANASPVYYYNSYNTYQPNYVAPPAPDEPVTYVNRSAYCREVSQEIEVQGQTKEIYGTACLQRDGSWKVMQ